MLHCLLSQPRYHMTWEIFSRLKRDQKMQLSLGRIIGMHRGKALKTYELDYCQPINVCELGSFVSWCAKK